jgi:hypothetical protein
MITQSDLYNLGYFVRMDMSDGSKDFKHNDSEARLYLINLKNGRITIEHSLNGKKQIISFDEFDMFKKWRDNYNLYKIV